MRDCKNSGGAKEEHDEEKVTVALHIGLPNNNNSSSNERKKVFHDDAAERFWIPTAAQTFTRYNNMQSVFAGITSHSFIHTSRMEVTEASSFRRSGQPNESSPLIFGYSS
ncbi:uncharacterized protein LOC130970842 isoform X1 [Arachis stenosperma]|uniref:uncharacterized protein LOC130970842 isoform X1 n=1 Tax=Arachis stenosperma TaxID=217475 RepID=UPI0025AC3FFC|nr:uncharacterized protein LOC130970842 isoform X1 [Arachis stenosperma]